MEFYLTRSAYGAEYSADVVRETTPCIREDGVSIPSQRERILRVTRDCKIRMIEQIVGRGSESNLRAFRQLEALLNRHITLRKPRSAQDITPCSAKLTGWR